MFGVLHICDYAAAYKGNFMLSLLSFEEYLKNQNVKQVYLFPFRAKSTDAHKWINQLKNQGHIIYIQSESFTENLKLLKKIKKEHSIKTVFRHFNNITTDILTKLVFPPQSTVHFFHSMYKTESKIKNLIKRFLYKNNILVGVSQAVSDALKKEFNNKVVTIHNAVNFDRLNESDSFTPKGCVSCLVMGYDILSKGTDLAIDVIKTIQEKYNIHLYIVTASHFNELEKLLLDKDVTNVNWITILPPTEKIATYYNNTDIFLAPSRFEGFSYALVEATYCKMSLVFSDISAHKLLKIDKRYMFENENNNDFKEKLETAISEINFEKSINSREFFNKEVINEYSLDSWCKNVWKLI